MRLFKNKGPFFHLPNFNSIFYLGQSKPPFCMKTLHTFILRITNLYVWLFFFVGYLAFAAYFMPAAVSRLENSCGAGAKIPDTEIGYNAAELKSMVAIMNEVCRGQYLFIATVTDSFYPFFYGGFFMFSLVFLYYKGREPFRMPGLYLPAILAALFDFAENSTLAHIVRHPDTYPGFTAQMASAFSLLKWMFAFAGILLILVGIGRVVVKRVGER
jgi:hypothetical protein